MTQSALSDGQASDAAGPSPRGEVIWLAVICLAYLAGLAALLPHCRHQINEDGISYLRVAGYWAEGDYHQAINGYWSPLLSWLLVPFARVQSDLLWASKLITGIGGLGLIPAAWLLYRRLGLSPVPRMIATVATAAFSLDFSTQVIAPDILAAALLTAYFALTLGEDSPQPRPSLVAGLVGGCAYLAKAYCLPFVLLHFASATVIRLLASDKPRDYRLAACSLLWAGAGMAVIAGPWIAALTWKYGHVTTGRVGPIAHALVAPGSDGAHPLRGLRLPAGKALTYWEDPSLAGLPYPYWSPFENLAAAQHQVRVVLHNAGAMRRQLTQLQPDGLLSVAVLAALAAAIVLGLRHPTGARQVWALMTIVTYASGYTLVYCGDTRYFWPLVPILLVLLLQPVDWLCSTRLDPILGQDRRRRRVACWLLAALLALSCVPRDALLERPRAPRTLSLETVAAKLRAQGVEGPLAANRWGQGLFLSYYLDLRYAGVPSSERPEDIVREARLVGVRTFLSIPTGPPKESTRIFSPDLTGLPGVRKIAEYPATTEAESDASASAPLTIYCIEPSAPR